MFDVLDVNMLIDSHPRSEAHPNTLARRAEPTDDRALYKEHITEYYHNLAKNVEETSLTSSYYRELYKARKR